MVALRKDVKVGLTIGAIAVSVIGVYAGLSALAGEAPAEGAKLNISPAGDARSDANSGNANAIAGNSTTVTTPGSNTEANPIAPITARPSTTQDPWELAFREGAIEPKTTVSPTPGRPAEAASTGALTPGSTPPANPPANDVARNAAEQGSTINAINGGMNGQKTASAGDSGSINNAANSELTSNPNTTAGTGRTHTVEPGETFSAISSQYYGESKYFNAIIAANPQVNPNKLKPGTVINIPELAKKEPASDTGDLPATGVASNIDATKQYVVKPGDSLHKISSNLWNDSAQSTKLYELNKTLIGPDPTKLKPGMILELPAAPTQTATR